MFSLSVQCNVYQAFDVVHDFTPQKGIEKIEAKKLIASIEFWKFGS